MASIEKRLKDLKESDYTGKLHKIKILSEALEHMQSCERISFDYGHNANFYKQWDKEVFEEIMDACKTIVKKHAEKRLNELESAVK